MKITPKVLIVDNEPDEVEQLRVSLGKAGFEPVVVKSVKEADQKLNQAYFSFILLDIALGKDGTDTKGLEYGQECARKVPGSVMMCTSAVDIDISERIFSAEIIRALNPSCDDELRRAFFAFGTKLEEGDDIQAKRVDLYVRKRRAQMVGNGDKSEFHVPANDPLQIDLNQKFRAIMWQGNDDVGEFFEIIKQLAFREPLPAPNRIELVKMGKGRSNTVVCLATLSFPGASDENEAGLRPLRNILKIGRAESVKKEAENYGRFVWQFLRPELYPKLEASIQLNQLGGLAYALVEDGTSHAKTLSDLLFDLGQPLESVLELCEQALDERILKAPEPGERHLLAMLRTRFHRLDKKPALDTAFARLVSEWSETGETLTPEQRRISNLSGLAYIVDITRDLDCDRALKFELSQLTLQHGDFHGDNILCVNSSKPNVWNLSFIDFANTGPQPCAIDHVILEISIRYQFLRFLSAAGRAGELGGANLFSQVFELNALTAFVRDETLSPAANVACSIQPYLDRLTQFVARVRKNYVRRYMGPHSDTAEAPRRPAGPADFLHQYLGSLTMAALSAVNLPMDDAVRKANSRWLSQCAGVALSAYNKMKEAKIPATTDPLAKAVWQRFILGPL